MHLPSPTFSAKRAAERVLGGLCIPEVPPRVCEPRVRLHGVSSGKTARTVTR